MRVRSVVTAGFAVTALVLAGCGSGEEAAPSTTSEQAAATTAASETAVSDSSDAETEGGDASASTPAGTAGSQSSAAPASSGADSSGDLAALAQAITAANKELTSITGTLQASANGQPLSQGEYKAALVDGQPTAMQLTTVTSAEGQQLQLELLMVDGVSYVGGEQILQQLGVAPGSGTWVQLDKNSPNPVIAQLAAEMEGQSQTQGPQQVEALVTDGQSLEEIGAEDINGTATTHYRVLIDGERALELSGSGASTPEAAQALPDAVPLDLWVDDQNRLVQVKMEFEVEGQVLTLMMGFTGFDEPVDIVAPTPEELIEPSAAPATT